MDKFDLDFLVDSQDANLLYKHLLKAICNNSTKIRDGINRYRIDLVTIHRLTSTILYSTEHRYIQTGRIDKYVMEL